MRSPQKELESLRKSLVRACEKSPLFSSCVPVFGQGPAPAKLMVIGEAPGRDETRLLTPFVGKGGGFFVGILREVFGIERDEYYITNVVKIWPNIPTARLKTRKPLMEEEEFFLPFLKKEIKIVNPSVILAVGRTAFHALFPGEPFVPGKWVEKDGFCVMPVYHPSYLLRKQKSLDANVRELKKALKEVKKRIY